MNMKKRTKLAKGTNAMANHHPQRFVSCSLRTDTATSGTIVAKMYSSWISAIGPPGANRISNSKPLSPKMITPWMRLNIQYSFRLARPEKTAYFFSTCRYHFMIAHSVAGIWPSRQSDEHQKAWETLPFVLGLLFELGNDRGIGERRGVAEDAAFGDIAQQAAHDFGAARLG
jgi:hypothetical protein